MSESGDYIWDNSSHLLSHYSVVEGAAWPERAAARTHGAHSVAVTCRYSHMSANQCNQTSHRQLSSWQVNI